MKSKILFTMLLLLFVGEAMAQCAFSVDVTRKNATCGHNGGIYANLSFLSNSSEYDFQGFTYHLERSAEPGIPITSVNNVDPVIGNLAPDTYNLIVRGLCISSQTVVEQKVFDIVVSQRVVEPFTVRYIGTGYKSLPNYGTGELKFSITGANIGLSFTVDILEHPVAYTGPKKLIVEKGNITIDGLVGSDAEPYKFMFSDGCRNVTTAAYYVEQLPSDFPSSDKTVFLINPNTGEVDGKVIPAVDLSKVRLSMGITNKYRNEYSRDWYECGYNLTTNNPSTAIWTTTHSEGLLIPSLISYKEYAQNGDNSTLGTPYTWMRLKQNPNDKQAYQTKVRCRKPEYHMMYDLNSMDAILTFEPIFESDSESWARSMSWHYGPITVKAVGPGYFDTSYNPASDGTNYPKLNMFMEPSFRGEYNFTVTMGEGANQYTLDLGNYDIRPKAYAELDFLTGNVPCVNFSSAMIRAKTYLPKKQTATCYSIFWFQDKNWVYTPYPPDGETYPSSLIPIQRGKDKFHYNNWIYLTSSNPDGSDSDYKPIPHQTYRWKVDVYPSDGGVFNFPPEQLEKTITISAPQYPEVVGGYVTPLTSLSQGRKTCQGFTFTLNRDEIWNKMKVEGTNINYPYVTLFAMYDRGINGWTSIYSTTLEFTGSTASSKSFIGLESAQEVVEFTVSEEWPLRRGDNTYPVYLCAIPNRYGSGAPTGNYLQRIITEGCYWRSSEPITVNLNDLSTVMIDDEKTGGYRCTSTSAGIMYIGMKEAGTYQVNIKNRARSLDFERTIDFTGTQGVISGLPAHISDYIVEVTVLDSQGNNCLSGSETREIHIQSLYNPRLAGYERGTDCVTGDREDLYLRATSIVHTSYKWYDPQGNVITTALTGAKTYPGDNDITDIPKGEDCIIRLPADMIKEGQYSCVVSVNSDCNPVIAKTPYVSLSGGVPLYWRVDAVDANWNNDENWNDALGQIAYRVPNKCTDVFIPGKVNSFYPNLDANITIGEAMCRDITFQYGAQTLFTNLLNYDRAFVEYNFKYYGSGVIPEEGDLPQINSDEYNNPSGSFSDGKTLSRNRWWMLASPLKEMATGDFELMGSPYTFNALYNKKLDFYNNYVFNIKNETEDNFFSVVSDNTLRLSDYYNAFVLWMPSYTRAVGGSQNILDNLQGIIRYPYFDDENIKRIRQISHNNTVTSLKKFNIANPAQSLGVNSVNRSYYDVIQTLYQANRFVYEDRDGNIAKDEFGNPVYKLKIKADAERVNGKVMIGNPFMAPIDFRLFWKKNQSKIQGYYYILENDIWKMFEMASNPVIAPQQAFVIELIDKTGTVELDFDINEIVVNNFQVRPIIGESKE
ncbi:MAG: hypothetical protein E6767_08790 [Dysgonomonas sp.]|nr:hypothetical protein [Dysgonomonas sp.]